MGGGLMLAYCMESQCQMAKAPNEIMTLDDLAAYVQLSKSSLYKLCQAGKVPGTKIGRHWRFHKDVIDAWIKEGIPPTQAHGRPSQKRHGGSRAKED
jgi:excisionase family DNA binding protein